MLRKHWICKLLTWTKRCFSGSFAFRECLWWSMHNVMRLFRPSPSSLWEFKGHGRREKAWNSMLTVISQGSWEKKIIKRVHNVNATLKKEPLRDDGDGTPKPKWGRPRQQSLVLTRYPPLRDTAAYSITTSRNIAALPKELSRDSPQKKVCSR